MVTGRVVLIAALLAGARVAAQPAPAPVEPPPALAGAPPAPVEAPPAPAEAPPAPDLGDPDFGPLVEVERIEITGNDVTSEAKIRAALLVAPGEKLRSGDPRLRASRFRLLALGRFRDVQLTLDKGARRGGVVLGVHVVERETLVVSRLDLGTSDLTALWVGADVGAGNVFGSGLWVSAAAALATAPRLDGGQPQVGLRLRVADPQLGVHGVALLDRASEPVGSRALGYLRVGASAGPSWELTPRTTLSADARFELVHADGAPPPHLEAGASRVVTLAVGIDCDTRSDPVLPADGQHIAAVLQAGGAVTGSSYDELKLRARYEAWHELAPRHVASLHLEVGWVAGGAPLFDRFYVGDLNPLLPDRKLDLVVSSRRTFDLLGRDAGAIFIGDLMTSASLEYAYQLFRGAGALHGGDLFVGLGVFALGTRADLRPDLWLDAGLRLDTAYGAVELSIANLASRLPL
jgi:outer membrane protein assembly factor BamA